MSNAEQQFRDLLWSWSRSPTTFVREALGASPEPWQLEVLDAIEHGAKRIAIRAGHGVGKTALESWIILWFLMFRRPCKIPVTANSQDQLRDVVWAEIGQWWRKMPPQLQGLIDLGADRISIKGQAEQAFAVSRTARPERPEALQGFHSENLLFVIEEASGIDDVIFETAGGALSTPEAMVLMCGNPTRTSGYFYRAFHENRQSWRCFHVPCSASSRVSPNYAQEIAAEYGIDSNVYRVRVLGEFPTSEDDAVIPLGLVEAAIGRQVSPAENVSIVWGLDVARFGDDSTALAKRRGNVLLEPVKEWKKLDLMTVAGKIMQEWSTTPPANRPGAINIDVIGLGGGVVDRLKELGLPVRGINVGEAAPTNELYMRLRDELWFKGREWFDARDVVIPRDEGLISELVQPKYKLESSGKIKVESKDDMKKRGVKSPNKADAFLLTLAGGDYAMDMHRRHVAVQDYDPFNISDLDRAISRQGTAGIDDYRPF